MTIGICLRGSLHSLCNDQRLDHERCQYKIFDPLISPLFVPFSTASSSSELHSLYFSKPGVEILTFLQKLSMTIDIPIGLLPIPTAQTMLSAGRSRIPPKLDKMWMMTALFSASKPTTTLSALFVTMPCGFCLQYFCLRTKLSRMNPCFFVSIFIRWVILKVRNL